MPFFRRGKPAAPRPAPEPAAPAAIELSHNEQVLVDGEVIAMASSNVEEITYRVYGDRPDGALYVRFKNGYCYKYDSVPLAVAVAFVESDSPGRFVWSHLRDRYPTTRLSNLPARPAPNVVRVARPGE